MLFSRTIDISIRNKIITWALVCLIISFTAFWELWAKIPSWLSVDGLQQHGVFHWGVLALCILWLWLKRNEILPRMKVSGINITYAIVGTLLILLSILLPKNDDFLLFLMLLGWLGVFTIVFQKASIIPGVLLGIYGFAVAFPLVMVPWLGETSAELVTGMVKGISGLVGLPLETQGTVLHFASLDGDMISTVLTAECAGYATLGVFIALFALMMLDVCLSLSKAWYVFLIGLVGTIVQNLVRIMLSLGAGYFWGSEALEAVHYNISYVIFPIWFGLFAFYYLKVAKRENLSLARGNHALYTLVI